MQIAIVDGGMSSAACGVVPVRKGALAQAAERLGDAGAVIAAAAAASRFEARTGSVFEHFTGAGDNVRRVLLVGVGEGASRDMERAGGAVTARLLTSGVTDVAVDLSGYDADQSAAFALGLRLRSWRMDAYRTRLTDAQKPTLAAAALHHTSAGSAAALAQAMAVADGVEFTRELVAEPGNVIYPESFVARCAALADDGITMEVLDEQEMAALGMGALIGVGQGSARPPRLLCLTWKGDGAPEGPPLLLIGKGVTFDTGGISLKPGAGMEDMKWDMGGAGAVVGAMRVLARRKAAAHVVSVCALAENMPDGLAQRPGDVVTTLSGQTVEVINTDAEGRLVLCDAMTWAQRKFAPAVMVDLATLTGAMIIALGREHGGMFSNDHELARQLVDAGLAVDEKLWRFPLSDAYNKLIDSPIADMKNVGPRDAGSITAAQYLQRFVDDGVHWAHLDIAGMVWSDKDGATYAKGATGYGVRLLDAFVARNFERKAD